jgi:hypothetical protein
MRGGGEEMMSPPGGLAKELGRGEEGGLTACNCLVIHKQMTHTNHWMTNIYYVSDMDFASAGCSEVMRSCSVRQTAGVLLRKKF